MNTSTFRRIAQVLFWPAVALTLVGALGPPSPVAGLIPWDKAEHFLAFYCLTVLAMVAFSTRRPVWIGLTLSAFGGLIEIVQGLPFVHRDADWRDWVADSAAIAAVLLVMAAATIRRSE